MRATATSFVRRLAIITAVTALLVPALPSAAGSGYGVYVSTNPNGPNTVEAFKRNAKTGILTSVGSFDTGDQFGSFGDRFNGFGDVMMAPLSCHLHGLVVRVELEPRLPDHGHQECRQTTGCCPC